MLANLQSVLRQAQRGKYAVGAFNVSDLEQAQAVITAAAALRSPVIINTSEKAIEYAGLEELAALVLAMAKKYPVPIVLNLDHGHDVALAKKCLHVGYSGIMFDGSRRPYAANVRLTKNVVTTANRLGIGVEGEIGEVKYDFEWKKNKDYVLTDPKQAADFVRQTKVSAFAVAIGNSHGLPRKNERLDFQRLKSIRDVVDVPLVLHGASGTPAGDIRTAVSLGITKINIDTDLRLAFAAALRATIGDEKKVFDPRSLLAPSRDAVADVVKKKITQFGSKGKAR